MHHASFQKTRASGMSLVDVMFAISVVAFASAALFLLYSNALRLVGSQQETEAATLCLQERAEQLRASNWDVLTSAAKLTTLLGTSPLSAGLLPSYSETVSVSAWPAVSGATKLSVTRATSGVVSVTSTNTTLLTATLLRVDLRTTWKTRLRTHVRENTLLLAQGGVVQ